MTDIAPSASAVPATANSASSAAAASDLTRSSSTPPDLDNLSSTNVFAFGLHSSYGAFANDSSAPLAATQQQAQPMQPAIAAAPLSMPVMMSMSGMDQQHQQQQQQQHSNDNYHKQQWHPTSPEQQQQQHYNQHAAFLLNQHNHNTASPTLGPLTHTSQQPPSSTNPSDPSLQSLPLDFNNPYVQHYLNSLNSMNTLGAMPSLPLQLPSSSHSSRPSSRRCLWTHRCCHSKPAMAAATPTRPSASSMPPATVLEVISATTHT